MKIKIRRNTFETNSSSLHSLVVKKGDDLHKFAKEHDGSYEDSYTDFYVDEDNTLEIWRDDDLMFGRYGFEPLSTPYDKFRYLIAANAGNTPEEEENRKAIIEAFKKIYPNIKNIVFPENHDGNVYYGYIDHQSDNLVNKFLSDNNISYYDFLAKEKYVILIDGDEYMIWNRLKQANLINADIIELSRDYLDDWEEARELSELEGDENTEPDYTEEEIE